MNKVIGLINLFFGIVEILVGIPYLLFTIPRLYKMYENLKVDLPYSLSMAYLYAALLILLGFINVLSGLGNFNIIFKNKSELMHKVGLFLVILSFVITGLVVSGMINSMINPVYNLSAVVNN